MTPRAMRSAGLFEISHWGLRWYQSCFSFRCLSMFGFAFRSAVAVVWVPLPNCPCEATDRWSTTSRRLFFSSFFIHPYNVTLPTSDALGHSCSIPPCKSLRGLLGSYSTNYLFNLSHCRVGPTIHSSAWSLVWWRRSSHDYRTYMAITHYE